MGYLRRMPESISDDLVTYIKAPASKLTPAEAREIAQTHPFAILGGLHRSGTTLLFRMLREHPEISGFANNQDANEWLGAEDEGQYLQSVYPPAIFWGGPGKFAFSPDANLTEESEFLTEESKAQLPLEWFPFFDLSKRFLLEKSPPNILWTRFLQGIFPNSWFVIIERHPVAVSLATEKWSPTGLPSLVEHWLVAHETFEKDRPHLKRVMTVKYETLISQPLPTLTTIYKFLGLEPHPTTTFEATSTHNDKYFAQWRKLGQDPQSSAAIQECIDKYEARVRAFGYSLQDLNLL
jgi:sulfotransferase family protein